MACVVTALGSFSVTPHAQDRGVTPSLAANAARLIAAYPDQLDRLDGFDLVFKDGTRMVFDDGLEGKPFDALLHRPDIKDQFAFNYPGGAPASAPPENFDPGRIRNDAFFAKMYGDCTKHEVTPRLVTIDWLPRKNGGKLAVTSINGVASKLQAVSAELDALPATFDKFLVPSAGVYNCRVVAHSGQRSVHAYGAAVDINAGNAEYWLWANPGKSRAIPYRNRIPLEIVSIFEKHGFIWGGRWYHYDTMHFEYRPELIAR